MIDRFRTLLASALLKAANLSFVPPWLTTAWTDLAFGSLLREGYKGNSAVWACVRVYARAFPEPEMHVWRQGSTGKERVVDHPARLLVARPNRFMGEDELWAFVITYMAIGGNAYLWKERSRSGAVVALWPMHDGQVSPVAGQTTWISHYLYDNGGGNVVPLPVEDVIHLRWAPDPQNPVRGLAPLVAAARAVDTDNEALRYTFALLKNDAVPRTIITTNLPLDPKSLRQMQEQWRERYGGENRGDIAVVSGDVSVSRAGANLAEMQVEALHNIPESRIAAAFEVPAVLAGLNVGLQRANALGGGVASELREFFTESSLVPRWRYVAGQFTSSLLPEFGVAEGLSCEFDVGMVRAFETDEMEKRDSVARAVAGGWMSVNEARAAMGLPNVSGGDVFIRPINLVPETAVLERGGAKGSASVRALAAPSEVKGLTVRDSVLRSVRERMEIADELAEDLAEELARVQERAAARARRNGGGA